LNGLGGKVPLDVDGLHAPITYGNGYAVVAAHNKVYAFRKADGELVWTKNFSSGDEYPIINNNTVYVSSENKIYAINLADGKILWTYNSPGRIGGMLYANNVLYTSNASSGIGDDPGYGFIEINTINGAVITQSFGSMYIFFHQFLPIMNINGVIYQSNQSSMNR
jgi:outer membrane protein assembly factor BamB